MSMPAEIPGRRLIAATLLLFAAVWIPLEGDMRLDFILSALILAAIIRTLVARYLAGRKLTLPQWLSLMMLTGLIAGGGLVLLTLFLMTLKTGLHAHGPEYTPAELAWVWSRLLLWSSLGLLAGLGLGLITAGIRRDKYASDP
jgi:hypothetical protein